MKNDWEDQKMKGFHVGCLMIVTDVFLALAASRSVKPTNTQGGDIDLIDANVPPDGLLDDLVGDGFTLADEEKNDQVQPDEEIDPLKVQHDEVVAEEGFDELDHFLPGNFVDRAATYASKRAYTHVIQVLDSIVAKEPDQDQLRELERFATALDTGNEVPPGTLRHLRMTPFVKLGYLRSRSRGKQEDVGGGLESLHVVYYQRGREVLVEKPAESHAHAVNAYVALADALWNGSLYMLFPIPLPHAMANVKLPLNPVIFIKPFRFKMDGGKGSYAKTLTTMLETTESLT